MFVDLQYHGVINCISPMKKKKKNCSFFDGELCFNFFVVYTFCNTEKLFLKSKSKLNCVVKAVSTLGRNISITLGV